MKQYQDGHFDLAAKCLEQLVSQSPATQSYRYLYANSLVKISNLKEARIQYQVGYKLDPTSDYGKLSGTALNSFEATKNIRLDPLKSDRLTVQLLEQKRKVIFIAKHRREFSATLQRKQK